MLQWQDAKPCGSGVRQYANGSVFLGEFCSTSSGNMAPNGIGICTVANGDIMAGRCGLPLSILYKRLQRVKKLGL